MMSARLFVRDPSSLDSHHSDESDTVLHVMSLCGGDYVYQLPPLLNVERTIIDKCATTTANLAQQYRDDRMRSWFFGRLAAEIADQAVIHPDYGKLAARVEMSQIYLKTPGSFWASMKHLRDNGTLSDVVWSACCEHKNEIATFLQSHLDADYANFTYRGTLSLQWVYLARDAVTGQLLERPAYMFMRIALALWPKRLDQAFTTFQLLHSGTVTLSKTAMMNLGMVLERGRNQIKMTSETPPILMDRYVRNVRSKNVGERYKDMHHVGEIANAAAHFGYSLEGSGMASSFAKVVTNAWIDTENHTSNEALCINRDVWDSDLVDVLTNCPERCNVVIWLPSVFLERLKEALLDGSKEVLWSFFNGECAKKLRGISGEQFDLTYSLYEKSRRFTHRQPIKDVLTQLFTASANVPRFVFKDVVCSRNPQNRHAAPIGTTTYGGDTFVYSGDSVDAVSATCSVNVSDFHVLTTDDEIVYDFQGLMTAVQNAVSIMNRLHALTKYVSDACRESSENATAIGIGVRDMQGLLIKCKLPYCSAKAVKLMESIMETVYFSALTESFWCAMRESRSFLHFKNSMYTQCIPQAWLSGYKIPLTCACGWRDESANAANNDAETPMREQKDECPPSPTCDHTGACACVEDVTAGGVGRGMRMHCALCSKVMHVPKHNWEALARDISTSQALFNSVVISIGDTEDETRLFGGSPGIDPLHSNLVAPKGDMYGTHKVEAYNGCVLAVHPKLIEELNDRGMWTPKMRDFITSCVDGRLQNIDAVPTDLKELFKTIWEIHPSERMRINARLSKYVDQGMYSTLCLTDATVKDMAWILVDAYDKYHLKQVQTFHRRRTKL